MWLRQDHQCNIAVNDPKGELYLKFYYIARKRGYRVVAFNLMNEARTDIYNPLGYAVEAARRGDNQKVEEYVKTIGDVFFPPDKSEDPMWPNAANAAFQRTALGLIDYYREEERELRDQAIAQHWSTAKLNRVLDMSWGHVTLYNVYQMMTQLAAKKSKDADTIHIDPNDPADEKDYLTLFFDATRALPVNALRTSVHNQDDSLRAMASSEKTIASVLGISLTSVKFFADEKIARLTSGRPSQNFDIVGLSFPRRFELRLDRQYVEDKGYRGARFKWEAFDDPEMQQPLGKEFEYENNIDAQGWVTYVTKGLFPHEITYLKLSLSEQGTGILLHEWYFRFKKGYQQSLDGRTYVIDPVSHARVVKDGTLAEMQRTDVEKPFKFNPAKVHSVNLNKIREKVPEGIGQRRILHNVFKKVVSMAFDNQMVSDIDIRPTQKLAVMRKKDGTKTQVKVPCLRVRVIIGEQIYALYFFYGGPRDGRFWCAKKIQAGFQLGDSLLKRTRISLIEDKGGVKGSLGKKIDYNAKIFNQVLVHYVEEPTIMFFVTPPHLRSYAKIILILLNQLFNMQAAKSYMTLKSQKPFYPMQYMLDEVGNLQSEGKGIPGLQTKESIGLGQSQTYTLILQTLQQLNNMTSCSSCL